MLSSHNPISIMYVIAFILLLEAPFILLESFRDFNSVNNSLTSERTFLHLRVDDHLQETRTLGAITRDLGPSINERARIYLFVFPTSLISGEWIRVSGVIIPKLTDVKIRLIYTDPRGKLVVRYVTTSGGGKFTDLFHPENVGRWTVFASWNYSGNEVRSEVMEFEVRRPTLYFYGLLISLISLIVIGLYVSFALFI